MNNLTQTFLDNEFRYLTYALKLTKNKTVARDILQDSFVSLCKVDPATVDSPKSYISNIILNKFRRYLTNNTNKVFFKSESIINDSSDTENENSGFSYGKQTKHLRVDEDKDYNILLTQILDIANKVCSTKEVEGIYKFLEGITEKTPRYETYKVNRRRAITKLQRYLNEQKNV